MEQSKFVHMLHEWYFCSSIGINPQHWIILEIIHQYLWRIWPIICSSCTDYPSCNFDCERVYYKPHVQISRSRKCGRIIFNIQFFKCLQIHTAFIPLALYINWRSIDEENNIFTLLDGQTLLNWLRFSLNIVWMFMPREQRIWEPKFILNSYVCWDICSDANYLRLQGYYIIQTNSWKVRKWIERIDISC